MMSRMNIDDIVPCQEECAMTWKKYFKLRNEWNITTAIYHGVYEHPHLSPMVIEDSYGTDTALGWVVCGMFNDLYTPIGVTRIDILRHIIAHGAMLESHEHITAMRTTDIEIFDELMRMGANTQIKYFRGCNILHYHVKYFISFIRQIWYYPEIQALVSQPNNDGRTPYETLDDSQKAEYPEIAEFLRNGIPPPRVTKRALR